MNTHMIEKKKNLLVVVGALLLIAMFLSGCEEGVKKNHNIRVSATVGYDGLVGIREGNPIDFSIDNKGGDFSGEIEIDIPINFNYKKTLSIPFEIPANSEKKLSAYIKVATVSKKIKYRLVSDDVVYSEGVAYASKVFSPDVYVVGYISDFPDNYTFFSALEKKLAAFPSRRTGEEDFDGEYYETEEKVAVPLNEKAKAIRITDNSILTNPEALQYFDYIYIGQNMSFNLKNNYNALQNWIKNGGSLIVEAGENYKKVFNSLPEIFVPITDVTISDIEIDTLSLTELNSSTAYSGKAHFITGTAKRDTVTELKMEDYVVAYHEKYGSGQIITINTMLSSEPVAEWNKDASYLNDIIYSAESLSPTDDEQLEKKRARARRFSWKNEYLPKSLLPSFSTIAMLLIIYILVVGPLLYSILKARDKSILIWIVAPVISIIIVVSISVMGNLNMDDSPIYNEISVISYNSSNNALFVDSDLNLFNDSRGDMKIEFPSSAGLSVPRNHDHGNYYRTTGDERKTLFKYTLGENHKYTYYDTVIWQGIPLRGKKIINVGDGGVRADLKIKDSGDELIIENNLPIQLKYPVLFYGGETFCIDDIKPNEKYTYTIGNLKEGYKRDSSILNLSSEEEDKLELFNDLLNNIFRHNIENNIVLIDEVKIVGFTEEPAGYDIKINGKKAKPLSRNIAIYTLKIPHITGRKVTVNNSGLEFHSRAFTVVDGKSTEDIAYMDLTFKDWEKTRNGQMVHMDYVAEEKYNAVETVFKLPKHIEVKEVVVDFNMNHEMAFDAREYGGMLKENYYVYNYQKDEFEEVTFDNVDLLDEKKYSLKVGEMLSPEGEVKIRVVKHLGNDDFMPEPYAVKMNEIEVKGVTK